jgi:hypothetical protein
MGWAARVPRSDTGRPSLAGFTPRDVSFARIVVADDLRSRLATRDVQAEFMAALLAAQLENRPLPELFDQRVAMVAQLLHEAHEPLTMGMLPTILARCEAVPAWTGTWSQRRQLTRFFRVTWPYGP